LAARQQQVRNAPGNAHDHLESEYRPETYGDRIADVYDGFYEADPQLEECVELLAQLAGDGPVMELGIGTGRVALPLQNRGVEVHGIDASQRMVDKLRVNPGGESLPISIGDMSDGDGPAGQYSLVFVVFNTFYAMNSQKAQVKCFSNVSDRLPTGGRFLIRGFVPDLERYSRRQNVAVVRNGVDEVRTDYATVDPVTQAIKVNHVVMSRGQVNTYPAVLRYCWPGKLDLMARLAGLELEQRWADWTRAPFNSHSGTHISVYRKN
jgi:SAM-dependent methyltransferase